ncbi:MAG: type II secretion system GspH family protein [Acidobacteria bacterium]|nr:type II secretion system GspH family protein [Acidobacteriota bacterium]
MEGGKGGRELTAPSSFILYPLPFPRRRPSGFTLLELMIVISVIIVLAMIAMAHYSQTVQAAKEATLRADLHDMRRMIDQYAADKGKQPESLEALVQAGYIQELPIDPMTGAGDWATEPRDDPSGHGSGVGNVHSSSGDTAADGTRYSDW